MALLSNARAIFPPEDSPITRRGFIYEDGAFLCLPHWMDHRAINSAFMPDEETGLPGIDLPSDFPMRPESGSKYMIAFMAFVSAQRWSVSGQHLSLSYVVKPNNAQRRAILKVVEEFNVETAVVEKLSRYYETLRFADGLIWESAVQKLL